MHKVAARYAKALLQCAVEEDLVEQICVDMRYVQDACTTHPALRHMLGNPLASHQQKLTLLQTLFQQKVHALSLQLFSIVTKKHREVLLPAIAQAFLAEYEQREGIVRAEVTTVVPLSEDLAKKLEERTQQITAAQQVLLTQKIDPALVGGYVLQVGDKQLDQSVRNKLNNFKKQLITQGYKHLEIDI